MEARWGAFAVASENTVLGTATGLKSKPEAVQMAEAKCRSRGGEKCKILLTYSNECAVFVAGNKKYLAEIAETITQASKLGMDKCNADDSHYRVLYSECTFPAWVEY